MSVSPALDQDAGSVAPPPLPARTTVAASWPPGSAVDAALRIAALVTSELALLVLAHLPPPGSPAADAARGIALLLFWLIAPGAVVVTALRLMPLTKVAATPLVGLSLLIGIATVGGETGVWIPEVSAGLVAVVTLIAAVYGLLRHPVPWRGVVHPRRPRRVAVVLVLLLLADVGLWVASVPAMRSAPASVLGLLVAGPPTFPASILGALLILLVALRTRQLYVAGGAVLALVIVLRTTASVVPSVPMLAWTYKHLGVVASIQEHHHVAAGMDIYMNWPGMFAASAYLSDSSGVAVIDLAQWTTPLVHILLALETAALARALGARASGCVAAAGLVVALNWVGQDYFSPQAFALVLATGVAMLLVHSRASRACAVLALTTFIPIVVTHQLTPFWLLILVISLAVIRCVPWWLAVAMVAVVAGYLAVKWDVVQAYGLISGFDPVANAAGAVPDVPALGREVGGLFAKSSSLLMWVSTALVLLARSVRSGRRYFWRDPSVLVPGAIAFTPVVLLGGQNYGGEAILRVTLYSTVGCCAVLGPALVTALQRRVLTAVAAAVWAVVVVASTTESTYTMWSVNLIRPEDLAAAQWLAAYHPYADVVPMISSWPGRTAIDYQRFVGPLAALQPGVDEIMHSQSAFAQKARLPLTPDAVTEVAQMHPRTETFLVVTANMRAYDDYYATFTPGSFQATLDSLARRPDWEVVRHVNGLWVFRYLGPL
ncbi:MAG TPA: hypothetical protein VGN28_13430 [Blastococcus sp.]|jgi:hypothetical protein|nr:hypothetical protein [Blastococcus sp.]